MRLKCGRAKSIQTKISVALNVTILYQISCDIIKVQNIRLEGMGFVPTPVELRQRRQPIPSPPLSSSVPSSASCAGRWPRS
ncbi:hypothetical protein HanIR_Chr05g0221621 [Helianthus annuus]|nr:hypothetical protein HanIR_Chr05g0221621 [Helianthus annuus]